MKENKEDNKFTKAVKWFVSALDNHSTGSSGKKWTAFILVVCVVFCHASWLKHAYATEDYSLLTTVLTIDFAFLSALFGLNITDKKLNGNTSITTKSEVTGTENNASIVLETTTEKK